MHDDSGTGIHDGGEWQLRVGSWELDMGRKVLWEEGRRYGKSRGREDFFRSAELFWLVTDFSSAALATRRRLAPEFGKNRIE